jgi:hypothetical protein
MTEETPEPSSSGSTSATAAGNQPQQPALDYIPSAATGQQFNADFPVLAASDDLPKLTASLLNNSEATITEVGKLMISYAKLYDSHAAYDAKYFDIQEENNKLQDQVNTLQGQLHSVLADPANQTAQVLQLTAQLTATNVEKERLYRMLENGGGGQRRLSPEHPNPDTFHGKDDRHKLSYFIKEMRDKLAVNADWYATEEDKMRYFKTRLRDDAYNAVEHGFAEDGTILFKEVSEIITLLRQSFGNVDEKGTSQQTIMKLRQNNKPTIEFLNEWLDVAQKTGFDDEAKIAHLKNALHIKVLERLTHLQLSHTPVAKDLTGFLAQIRYIDSIIRSIEPNYTKARQTPNHNPHLLNTQAPEITTPLVTTTNGGDAMDLNAATVEWSNPDGTRRPKNDAERKARKEYNLKHGLCLWCDMPGHVATYCCKARWNSGKAIGKDGVTTTERPGNA